MVGENSQFLTSPHIHLDMVKSGIKTGLMGESDDDLSLPISCQYIPVFEDEIAVRRTILPPSKHLVTGFDSLPGKEEHLIFRPREEIDAVYGEPAACGRTEESDLPWIAACHPVSSVLHIINHVVMEDDFLLCAIAIDCL